MVTWERIWVTRGFHIVRPIMYFVFNWILFRKMLILENLVFTFPLLFTNLKFLPFLVNAGCYDLLSGFYNS